MRVRLLPRVVLHGVVLLGVSAIGFVLIAAGLIASVVDRDMQHFMGWFGEQACAPFSDATTAGEAPARLARIPGAVAVFTENGERLGASSEYQVPALSEGDWASIRGGAPLAPDSTRFAVVKCAGAPSRYAIVGRPRVGVPFGRLGGLVALLVALIAVGSIPLARSLVRPIRELAAVANTFGKGDLGARATTTRTDEIGDLAIAFNRMAANLQAHLLAEKELLANVSHELRTPLARVRVVLETAKEDPARAASLLDEIARDLTDLERLTSDVLTTIRLDFADAGPESARIRSRPEPVDLVSIARRAVVRCVESNVERDVELDAANEVPPLEGDPALLLRLLENLLENACKYSSNAVRLRVRASPAEVTIEVEDEGIGIEQGDLARVFQPFFRSERSRARGTGGVGIGLALCRRIVEVHRGTIEVKSAQGQGTTVTVRLPLGAAPWSADREVALHTRH